MSVHTIDPYGLSAAAWADAMVLELDALGNLGRLDDETQWQEWGAQLLNLPGISGSIVPNPYEFGTWREWAERLNDGLAAVM